MKEQEWQTCCDPLTMLGFLGDRASVRKRQLFALACYELAREFLDEWGQRGLEVLQSSPEAEDWLSDDSWREDAWSDVEEALAGRFWRKGDQSGIIGREEDLWPTFRGTLRAISGELSISL